MTVNGPGNDRCSWHEENIEKLFPELRIIKF